MKNYLTDAFIPQTADIYVNILFEQAKEMLNQYGWKWSTCFGKNSKGYIYSMQASRNGKHLIAVAEDKERMINELMIQVVNEEIEVCQSQLAPAPQV